MASASVSMIRTSFGGIRVGLSGSWIMGFVTVVICSENLTVECTDEMGWKVVMDFEAEELKSAIWVWSEATSRIDGESV